MKAHLARTSVSVSAKDGHYREVASLHVPIITKRLENATRRLGTRKLGIWSPDYRNELNWSEVRAIFSNAMTLRNAHA